MTLPVQPAVRGAVRVHAVVTASEQTGKLGGARNGLRIGRWQVWVRCEESVE